jgi:hypothetical protein
MKRCVAKVEFNAHGRNKLRPPLRHAGGCSLPELGRLKVLAGAMAFRAKLVPFRAKPSVATVN